MFMFISITSLDGWLISNYVNAILFHFGKWTNSKTTYSIEPLAAVKLGPWERLSLTLTVRLGA